MSLQDNSEVMRQHERWKAARQRLSTVPTKPKKREKPAPETFVLTKREMNLIRPHLEALLFPTPSAVAGEAIPKFPAIIDVLRAVSKHYGMSIANIISERRTKNITRPRMVAMYLCRELTPRSYPQIGRMMGNRDHTTVMHGAQKIASRIATDPELSTEVETIKAKILEAVG